MITSTPPNTSKSNCRCDQNCGCCSTKTHEAKKPGIFGRRPWLLVLVAFGFMFSAWAVMIYLAATHQPATVPLVTDR